ncbi:MULTISPECIES: ABC transporter substrate-binding protein [Geobacillus]|jgi:glucose/mannose transport system substrate-binding protein|uniref:Probable sugar-binding periplasmic protein n=2 Tax=Geobacillus thermodenitrificans TaxID=33940 RepID=A4IT17_GEOTN|nr:MULTISPECIES: ABC transporter substrate-binding protein [Geobacillus]ABO68471.1 ABC transporter substrate-binding protein [Geobacillus thermodenitrificans NG80-2]ARP44186.1 putative sugar-binding periplasmic protein [Geobacillus thermodenitrificans]ATO37785.1 ABC transporter substrate-binding protein [Geobacillus thermodenitrificans]KQB91721.1 ABC transporter substrate-binding protein [Geobacillus sp. PA-3]MEC5187967.1 glucose/mannose transport system substrate-binding protein [Geobacillus 
MRKKASAWLALALGVGMALSGCSSNSSSSDDAKQGSQKAGEKLEIFSWWTGAGEEDGLKALIKLFQEKHPDIEVENAAVAGGAGTNAKAVLASRMQGDDPPSTFQVHGGAELNEGWVAAGKMEPLNDLYEQEGWMDKFPEALIDMVSKDGNIYSVPVNIHRGNVLWYNKKVFADNGLQPPKTFDEFFEVADQLKAKGVTPLALGDKEPWTATHLFETVLLGTLGTDNYQKLWNGELSFDAPQVKQAVETFKKMLGYINEDHSSRNWQDAAQLVAEGKAAMYVMGDWAKGYFVNDLKLKVNEDFGYVPTPNTDGKFMVITDTFGLPKGVKNPDDVKKFLALLGSVEGQDAFNPLKGSIPARIDADPSKYDEYGKQTMEDFKNAELAPSLAHGSAAAEGFVTKVNQAINIFVTQKDVNSLIDTLVSAAAELKK